jgi:raffinose/stachyose/melibiose transport system permease protein
MILKTSISADEADNSYAVRNAREVFKPAAKRTSVVSAGKISLFSLFEICSYLILAGATVLALFPIGMAILNSLKTDGEIMNNILAFPAELRFSNYIEAFRLTDFLRSMMNTIIVISTGLAGIVFFGAMSGYKLSRTHSRLSGILFGLFVMSMLIPFHSIMITLTRVARAVHVQGTPVGLGLIYIGLGVPMAIFLYHGFIKSVPRELDEAALIDGCGEFRFFVTIVFPLVAPITVTVMILNTLWMWNDFLLPLIMITDSDSYTVMLSTNILFGQYSNNDWSAILATLVLAMLPMVTLYLFLQKYIMKGISEGALKG